MIQNPMSMTYPHVKRADLGPPCCPGGPNYSARRMNFAALIATKTPKTAAATKPTSATTAVIAVTSAAAEAVPEAIRPPMVAGTRRETRLLFVCI